MQTIIYKIISFTGIILVSGYLFISLFLFPGKKSDSICKELKIVITDKSDIQLIDEDKILSLISKNGLNPSGKALKEIETEAIENELKKNKFIKSVESYITPSGNVRIEISQRKPKFRVIGNDNYYIDSDRTKIPTAENYTAYIPIVTGRLTDEFATGKLFDFITFLEKDNFWNAQIEQINILNNEKVEFVTRVGDAVVLLGNLDDYKTKLAKLQKLYTEAFNVMGWEQYKKIDLQYNEQIVCTKK